MPILGVMRAGDVAKTTAPDPVSPVTAAAKFALEGVARKVESPAPNPVTPVSGTLVAPMVPVPVTPKLAPEPTSMAAEVLVPPVRELKEGEPLPGQLPNVGAADSELQINQ